jgi:hypothetical protein
MRCSVLQGQVRTLAGALIRRELDDLFLDDVRLFLLPVNSYSFS